MDYGHTPLTDNSAEFSSPSSFGGNENLAPEKQESTWDQPVSIEHDKKSLGSEALANSLEMPPLPDQELGKPIPYSTNLEPIVQPPVEDAATDADIVEKSLTTGLDSVKTTDRLAEESVKATDDFINKFEKGEIALEDFYDSSRDAMENNLNNSYNRKLGEGKFE